jgi:hypothetical protein
LELVLRKHKILLLSDEGFSSRPDTGYKYSNFLAKSLKYFLREFDVKVLVYLRRQDSFYESWYTQRIQAGTTSSDFHQFWRDFSFQNINYLKVINAYADAFGESNLIVRPYMKDKLKDGNVIHDFLEIIGVSDIYSLNFDVPFANNSISVAALKAMRAINEGKHKGRISESERSRVRRLLQSTNSKR